MRCEWEREIDRISILIKSSMATCPDKFNLKRSPYVSEFPLVGTIYRKRGFDLIDQIKKHVSSIRSCSDSTSQEHSTVQIIRAILATKIKLYKPSKNSSFIYEASDVHKAIYKAGISNEHRKRLEIPPEYVYNEVDKGLVKKYEKMIVNSCVNYNVDLEEGIIPLLNISGMMSKVMNKTFDECVHMLLESLNSDEVAYLTPAIIITSAINKYSFLDFINE